MKMKAFLCPLCLDITDSFTLTTQTETITEITTNPKGEIHEYQDDNPSVIREYMMCDVCGDYLEGHECNAEDYLVEVEYSDEIGRKITSITPIGNYWKEHKEKLDEVIDE